MRVGEVCHITCKPEYAYGSAGSPPKIPPNATLVFEVSAGHRCSGQRARLYLTPLPGCPPALPASQDNVAKPEGLALGGGEVERLAGSAATRVTSDRGFGLEEGRQQS